MLYRQYFNSLKRIFKRTQSDTSKNFKHLEQQEHGSKMGEMCIFPKRNRVAGILDIKLGGETIAGKVRFYKKPPKPQKISELRSFFGSINQYMKFVLNLSTLSSPLRPLLLKNQSTNGTTKAFEELKKQIVNITENNHFDIQRMSRLKTDASHSGLGATLEQWDRENWLTKAFASRFLNSHEMKYSKNELELLRVVWATEHFKNYLYGAEFEIVTDHKALLSALNANQSNKTMHSRLTRCVNRLLPFNFKIKHIPGKDTGFTDFSCQDYLQEKPYQPHTTITNL